MSEARQLAKKKRLALVLRMRELQRRQAAQMVGQANGDARRAGDALTSAGQDLRALETYQEQLLAGDRLAVGLYALAEPFQAMAHQRHALAEVEAYRSRQAKVDAALGHHRAVAARNAIDQRLHALQAEMERHADHAQVEAACALKESGR